MNIVEEHTAIRGLLQALRKAPYRYQEPVISGFDHQPVRLFTGVRPKPAGASVSGADPAPSNRPSALAFALSAPAGAGNPAPAAAPAPAPPPPPDRPSPWALTRLLAERGHRLLARDGKLFVSNASALTDDDRAAIRAIKPELLALAEPWPSAPPPSALTSFLSNAPPVEAYREPSLAVFLGSAPAVMMTDWKAQDPPEHLPHDIILNFETNGLNWAGGDEPVGVTIGTFDGFKQYLPFAHQGGGNLDRAAVMRFLKSLRGHHITNVNTRFDLHMGRNLGVDFEEQDCTVSDVQHWAALLDDHRRRFSLDVLADDFLGGSKVPRVDERQMANYAAADVAARAEYQAQLVAELKEKLWPMLEAEDLLRVKQLEDDTIYPVVEMEKNGSQLDVELVERFFNEATKAHDDLMWELTKELGFAFEHTASGWKKLLEHYALPVPDSFAENVLNTIDHPMIRKAQRAAQFASLNSKTFAAYRKNIDSNGILRYDINQLRGDDGGTVSGRFSIGWVQQVPNHDNHHSAFGEGNVNDCHGECWLFPRRCFIGANGADYLEFRRCSD